MASVVVARGPASASSPTHLAAFVGVEKLVGVFDLIGGEPGGPLIEPENRDGATLLVRVTQGYPQILSPPSFELTANRAEDELVSTR